MVMTNKLINTIKKEDYAEQCCPLKKPGAITPINVRRVLAKLDEYLNANDYAAAERHLKYWRSDAHSAGDLRGELTVLNEQIGLYRKMQQKENGLAAIEAALDLASELDIAGTISYGTTLLNAATAYKAFDQNDKALPLYEKAREIYEAELSANDPRMAGLYNNMSIALRDAGNLDEAKQLLSCAIDIVLAAGQKLEAAISYCNLADLIEAKSSAGTITDNSNTNYESQIFECMDKAEELLDSDDVNRDGYYAFVCEKCAPVFGYYGYFAFKIELEKRAKEIYDIQQKK